MTFNISNMPEDDLTNDSNASSQPSFGTKLGYFAAFLTTVADFLTVVSAGIVIDESIEDAKKAEQEKTDQEQRLIKMQNQIDSLQKEIKLLKKGKKGQ